MKNIRLCIVDMDAHYRKAFINAVALGHTGYTVTARDACGEDCAMDVDVCMTPPADAEAARVFCPKAFAPVCGRYAGTEAILGEARAFAFDRAQAGRGAGQPGGAAGQPYSIAGPAPGIAPFGAGALLCVYACAGGQGTSCSAIGLGREFARYRGERVLYLSLEDTEDPGLFQAGARAMRAEETLYRYMRIEEAGAEAEAIERLFHSAAACDEYGLYRLAPDEGAGSLGGLGAAGLRTFLWRISAALRLTRIVLDFGTRLHCLLAFAALLDEGEAVFIEAFTDMGGGARKRRPVFADAGAGETDTRMLSAAFPFCPEDIRRQEGYTDVGLANSFGLAVKELCDRIVGDGL